MQCVSYKQMCYQAVNTKVMGLLVLISVFISVILCRDFFPVTSRSRPHLCLLHGTGKLSCGVSAGTVTLSPHASHLQPHQWQSSWAPMGVTMLQCPWRWRGLRRGLAAWLKSQSSPWSLALQFLLVWRSKQIPHGQGDGKDAERGLPFTLSPL